MWKKGRRPHGDTRGNTQHIQIPPPHQTHVRSRSRFFIRLLSRQFPRHHLPALPGTDHGGDGEGVVWDWTKAGGDNGDNGDALTGRNGHPATSRDRSHGMGCCPAIIAGFPRRLQRECVDSIPQNESAILLRHPRLSHRGAFTLRRLAVPMIETTHLRARSM